MAAWATIGQAHAHWPDSASLPDATLTVLLDVATVQCEVFAPAHVDPVTGGPLMLACVYQAREVYAAGQRDGDIIGLGDYAIRARPLTSTVKSLLRPQPGVPAVGSVSARSVLVDLLSALLPTDIDVITYAHNIDPPSASTVMVRVDTVTPSPAGMGLRVYGFALVLVAAKTTAGPADDELDALLEDVLAALSSNDTPAGVTWSQATRATYGEPDPTNPAYEVAVAVTAQIGD